MSFSYLRAISFGERERTSPVRAAAPALSRADPQCNGTAARLSAAPNPEGEYQGARAQEPMVERSKRSAA